MPRMPNIELEDGMNLAYRELGEGPPVLLLHGWPTSSYLWRKVVPRLARGNRVLALDLPGFGASDKPVDARYDFELFERALDGFLEALAIDEVALGLHDLGGPIGVRWALRRPGRVTRIGLLNTLLYPEFSDMVLEFVGALLNPEQRDRLTSPEGLAQVMRLGVEDESIVTDELMAGVLEPFKTDDDRLALARAGVGLEPSGFEEIAAGLPSLEVPVRIVYGARDRILPDVAQTMARVQGAIPHAEVTALPDCGHFIPEEAPERVAELLGAFFAERVAAG